MIEILSMYMEKGPVDGCIKRSEDGKTRGRIEYPALAREPATSAPGVVNVAFCLPYGSRVVRGFLATNPIEVLWSFASTQIKEDKEFELVCHTWGIKLKYDDHFCIVYYDKSVMKSRRFINLNSKAYFTESSLIITSLALITRNHFENTLRRNFCFYREDGINKLKDIMINL